MALKITGTNTAAAPGITGDDTDTGLFYASDALGFSTGGTEKLRLNGSNLGLNTASPAFPSGEGLEIYSSANPRLKLSNSTTGTSGTDGTQIYLSNANTIIDNKDSGDILIHTNADEKVRITSGGLVLVGHDTSQTIGGGASGVQVNGSQNQISAARHSDNQSGAYLSLGKSRSGANPGSTIVQDGDALGYIQFAGADGTDINSIGASIGVRVDGTPGSNDMPGRLVFSTTADGAASPTERLRIDSSGKVGIGRTNPGHLLHLQSSNTDDYVANTATNNTMLMLANSGAVGANHCVSLGFNGTSTNGEGYISLVAEDTSNSDLRFSLRRGGSRQDVFTMHSNGDITVPSGSIKLSESGQGINFHAHGTGSGVSSNVLDDYEEGTWDPTAGSSSDIALNNPVGVYTKIGNVVHVQCYFSSTSAGTMAVNDSIAVEGLPFSRDSNVIPPAMIQINYNSTNGSIIRGCTVNTTPAITGRIGVTTGHNRSGPGYQVSATYRVA